jgi:hypothetical protein
VPEQKPEKEIKINMSFTIEGDLARAFLEERRKTLNSKSEIGRAALVEYLNARGHNVQDTTSAWGGYRERRQDEEEGEEQGQLVPAPVG